MVRAPCCEKMGVKKGAWAQEEDQILISYITQNGHSNWRALPKLAGLARCGKSCRLRWTNYLRPDIKRGNFSREEEDTIIQLHESLGNRWSAIAAKLPGRTDNEIKNVWHTQLKKKLEKYQSAPKSKRKTMKKLVPDHFANSEFSTHQEMDSFGSISRQTSSSELSSVTCSSVQTTSNILVNEQQIINSSDIMFKEIEKSFMAEEFEVDGDIITRFDIDQELQCQKAEEEGMEFWYNLFIKAEELPELPEF